MTTPKQSLRDRPGGGDTPKGQAVLSEALILLNRLTFDATCGADLQGTEVYVSVMPTTYGQKEGHFGVTVTCRARNPQQVTWSALRVYAVPEEMSATPRLGPALDRFGQALIDNLAASPFLLRAYKRPGEEPLRVQAPVGEIARTHGSVPDQELEDSPPKRAITKRGGRAGRPLSDAAKQWTDLPPQIDTASGITLHRRISGTKVRIEFSCTDEVPVDSHIECCVVVRETGELLIQKTLDLKRRSGHPGSATEYLESTFDSGVNLEVLYRIVAKDV